MKELSDKERIEKLIENVMSVAQGDFSVQNKLSGKNDELDALAMGLNMLIDDLKNSTDLAAQNRRIKAINEELQKAKEKAQESDRLKSAFLANMSHEIRSPMNAILGFSTLLGRDSITPGKRIEYSSCIENSGKQLMALIDDIIDISKIESNQLKIDLEMHCVNELLTELFELFKQDKRLLAKKDLRLFLTLDHQKEYCLQTDQVRFKQIISNLVGNAIKYTDSGYIEFGYEALQRGKEQMIKIYVRDTGAGIPEELQGAIFDRFMQAHDNKFEEGTGLGLSITKGLVELLGGEISLESQADIGSAFYVIFPCSDQTGKKKDLSVKKKRARVSLAKYTIYIAEDKLESYILMREFLKPYGVSLKHAQNGQELIDMVSTKVPDLVLLDIHMPVKNGYETIAELRSSGLTFPVIAQTAYAMADEQNKILESGCDGYLSKPVNPDELILLIQKHLKITG
ncbi:MAG: response regulator [Bacteroidales bacterium]|nr:response regulator [Bacteroidales bacterium]